MNARCEGMLDDVKPKRRFWRIAMLTQGEQSILLAFAGVAFCGGALALNVVMTLGGQAALLNPFDIYDYWVILSGIIGACAGLYLGRNWMGHKGARGFGAAIIGIIWISFLGALVGGSMALPLYGTMFGPFTLFVSLFSAPLLALLWVNVLVGAHFLLAIWRTERDTIFDAVLPTDAAAV